MRIMITAFILIFLASTISIAQEPSEYEKAARDFNFEGTKLGISLQDFQQQVTNASELKERSRPEWGLKCLFAKPKTAAGVTYSFFEQKLYQIQIIYEMSIINRMGGVEILRNKLLAKFGAPERVQKDTDETFWIFIDVNRGIFFTVKKKNSLC